MKQAQSAVKLARATLCRKESGESYLAARVAGKKVRDVDEECREEVEGMRVRRASRRL